MLNVFYSLCRFCFFDIYQKHLVKLRLSRKQWAARCELPHAWENAGVEKCLMVAGVVVVVVVVIRRWERHEMRV